MNFEYDADKSASNKAKHGIDFEETQALWLDEGAIQIKLPFEVEPRYFLLAMIQGKHWTAVITYRGETIRIISVRRSRQVEVEYYEEQNQR